MSSPEYFAEQSVYLSNQPMTEKEAQERILSIGG